MFRPIPKTDLAKNEFFALQIGPSFNKQGYYEMDDERPIEFLFDKGVTVGGSDSWRLAKTFKNPAQAEKFFLKHVQFIWEQKTGMNFSYCLISWEGGLRNEYESIKQKFMNRVKLNVLRKTREGKRTYTYEMIKEFPFF